ncbi:hypothetical protein RYZ18_13070 [Roseovarius sp. 10]|uniref:hypothetical protein n=1 Tax=Roseovarius sp. 10 TaxID=3080563 RepID=UPI00295472C5|nr:hypothetical protein [Roseovarius sp. 10]MDV7202259.1 hypothetical protein [Roseovarius sp. 10]
MTEDQYVASILQKYAVNSVAAKRTADAVAPLIRSWAGTQLANLFYSGSFAKGTGNKLSADVDLFISLKSDTRQSLKEIYESLFSLSQRKAWSPVRQNVSIGITHSGMKLDLVPGKIQSGYQNYHSLYRRKTDGWTQTNIKLHIDTISKSGRQNEIRAIKIWRNLHNLDFPSFFLELMVLDALKGKSTNNLSANVISALSHIGKSLPTTRVIDPANTNNIISDDMTKEEKNAVAAMANASIGKKYWKDIIW